MTTPTRRVTCRYLSRFDNRCTAEVVDETGEIHLCQSHLAAALALLNRRCGLVYQPTETF